MGAAGGLEVVECYYNCTGERLGVRTGILAVEMEGNRCERR